MSGSLTLADMTANRLNSVEPQRGNNGKIHILGLSTEGGTDDFSTDTLVLACQTFPVPKWNTNVVSMAFLNEDRKYAGKGSYDDLSVTYKDLIGVSTSVSEILYKWRATVQDPATGKIGFQGDYKKNGYAVLFDSKGANARVWKLYGIWPSAYDPGQSDQTDDANIMVSITLTVDKMIFSPDGSVPGAWSAGSYPGGTS